MSTSLKNIRNAWACDFNEAFMSKIPSRKDLNINMPFL